ncbi:DUF4215 domain-containing protein [Paraliomyxa miuraensis]|uniref:DUF4215 domain-containing protein n=1 Tax=Paraliomyxa miuraensis TaxID=376150 RepID=UPI0022581B75|nr:DUF4215 domain-containing protein [Paraliomyxa miuraensis]MCX4242876.1 DUF4215 domain-containing protein [Paraliomyxa miuraensis]
MAARSTFLRANRRRTSLRAAAARCLCVLAVSLGVGPALLANAAVVPAELVARAGDIPLGATVPLATTLPPFTLPDGTAAFTGTLADGDVYVFIDDQVVWLSSNEMMSMLTGTEASMGATTTGGFIYGPSVDGVEAVWTHNGLLAMGGTQAPVYPAGVVTTFHSRPTMVPTGTAYWVAGLDLTGGGTTQERVLYRSPTASPADVQVVLATGDMVGGLVIDSPTGIDLSYQISDDETHHVAVLLMDTGSAINDGHVFLDGALLHQENTPNGTGDNWDNFDLVAVNNAGSYVFSGDTTGVVATDEFIARNGVIVIREGDVLDGVTLTTTAVVRFLSVAESGRVAHAWSHANGAIESLFYACDPTDLGGSSLAILSTGIDELDLDGDGVGDALVTDLNASGNTHGDVLTNDGSIYLEVDIDDMSGAGPLAAMVRIPVSCCGNGILDDGEECDDGNGDDTDACPTTCTVAECGDAFVLAGIEECDDGNMSNLDACLVGCVAAMCGDGFLWAGVEFCDDGNGDDTDGCPSNCMAASCGDGFVWAGVEECDDGNTEPTDACLPGCIAATCGDGFVWAGTEECDDANEDDTDECPGNCLMATCGDGFVWTGMEECDDGNTDDGDGCTRTCTMEAPTSDSSGGSTGSNDTGSESTGTPGTSTSTSSGGLDESGGSTGLLPPMSDGTTSTGSTAGPSETEPGPFPGLDDDGGCACRSGRRAPGSGVLGLLVASLGLGASRRRRRR